jgi:hypothetical protein
MAIVGTARAACALLMLAIVAASLSGARAQGGQPDDMTIISSLIQNRAKISRSFTKESDGITSYTHSTDAQVVSWIHTHVTQMKARVVAGNRIRQKDPLFVSVFDHAADLQFTYVNVSDGVRANQTSASPCGVALIHAHAQVVSDFIRYGDAETAKDHDVPEPCPPVESGASKQLPTRVAVASALVLGAILASA